MGVVEGVAPLGTMGTTGTIAVTEGLVELPDQTAEDPAPDEPECEELGADMLAAEVILLQGPEETITELPSMVVPGPVHVVECDPDWDGG